MANDEVRLVGDFSTPDFFADEAILFDLVNDTVRSGSERFSSTMFYAHCQSLEFGQKLRLQRERKALVP